MKKKNENYKGLCLFLIFVALTALGTILFICAQTFS
jgi:hypothetical protein